MKGGLFSFFLVVAFIPSVLYAASLHSQAAAKISHEKTLLIEQQVLTNKEYEFEQTFWSAAVNSARKRRSLESGLETWRQAMESREIDAWSGPAGPGFDGNSLPGSFECIVELSPDGKSVEVKRGTNPYYAIGATVRAGNSTSVFLIPAGCSRGL